MELKVNKIDKETKGLFTNTLAQKKDKLKAEGKLEEADEVDMFLFCLEQADEE